MVHNYIVTTNNQFDAPSASECSSTTSPPDVHDEPPPKRLKLLANYIPGQIEYTAPYGHTTAADQVSRYGAE